MSSERVVTVGHAVRVLQRAFEKDPQAMNELFRIEIPCNTELGEDPTVQVNADTETAYFGVRPIGIINGIFGVDGENIGAIEAVYELFESEGKYRLTGFRDNGRKVVPK